MELESILKGMEVFSRNNVDYILDPEEQKKILEYIEKLKNEIKELKMFKSLYQNEKSHTDTLKRIIKKIEEILQKEYKENVFDHYEYDLATAKNTIKKILNLLKEIK